MRTFIDGLEYTGLVDGVDDFEVEYQLDSSNGTVVYAATNSLTFIKDAFEYLEDQFFNAQSQDVTAEVLIVPDCCDVSFLFEINAKTIRKYCPGECYIESSLVRKTVETNAHDYLSNTIFWKNGFINAFPHPKVQYCDSFTFLNFILLAIYFLLSPVIVLLKVISNLPIIGGLPGINQLDGLLEDFEDAISGCKGKFHPSPVLNDIFNFNCDQAGVSFSSSIIGGNYNTTALLQAQYVGGCESCGWIEKNAANLTMLQLADILKPVFQADFRIRDGKFIFEREDFFRQNLEVLVNVDSEYQNKRSEEAPCYSYVSEDANAYGRFEYSSDPIDTEGNLVANLYNDLVEWNPANSPFQKGEFNNVLEFSPAHFVNDEEQAKPVVTNRRKDHVLLLRGGVSANFKLLFLEQNYNQQNAYVKRRFVGGNVHEYNFPLWFQEGETEGLYDRFGFIKDPRQGNREVYQMEDFEYQPEDFCASLSLVDTNGIDLDITTVKGTGKAESIVVKFATKTLTLKGVKIT